MLDVCTKDIPCKKRNRVCKANYNQTMRTSVCFDRAYLHQFFGKKQNSTEKIFFVLEKRQGIQFYGTFYRCGTFSSVEILSRIVVRLIY